MDELSRMCIHTVTTKPWDIETSIDEYARAGAGGITVWRDALQGRSIADVRRRVADAGLSIVSTCRGGFFPSVEPSKRQAALAENREVIAEAAELGAPLVVLVCGADPKQSLDDSRAQIVDAIAELAPEAERAGVKLAIEPLHPMYADAKSAINTMKSANDAAERIGSSAVGVAVDVYHIWWDPDLEKEIARCGELGKIFAFHVCDWRVPTRDFLLDRGLMGEGCIDIPKIRGRVEQAGFNGFVEVEIFSTEYWSGDQSEFLGRIVEAFKMHV